MPPVITCVAIVLGALGALGTLGDGTNRANVASATSGASFSTVSTLQAHADARKPRALITASVTASAGPMAYTNHGAPARCAPHSARARVTAAVENNALTQIKSPT